VLLGRNGRHFFRDSYDWPVIERKYLDMLARLSKEAPTRHISPLPGWADRRRRNLPPAREVLAQIPRRAAGRLAPAETADASRRQA
jgi:hypothetical protein